MLNIFNHFFLCQCDFGLQIACFRVVGGKSEIDTVERVLHATIGNELSSKTSQLEWHEREKGTENSGA